MAGGISGRRLSAAATQFDRVVIRFALWLNIGKNIMSKDKIDAIWDRADFAAATEWREMDEFLQACEEKGPPTSDEDARERDQQFIEIQKRQADKALAIMKRARAGDVAPHLKVVGNTD
jgi:hypothetical protein